jgi:hypothetical protein
MAHYEMKINSTLHILATGKGWGAA